MKVEDAKKRIKEYQKYVNAYENYVPESITQMAVKLYAELNNVGAVAERLNELGYRKEGRLVAGKRREVKLYSNDVTALLISEPAADDEFHPMIIRILNKNRRRKGIVT